MGYLDRVLLALYALFLTVFFVMIAAVMAGWPAPLFVLRDLFYPERPELFWPLIAALILAGGRLFWVSVAGSSGKRVKHVVLAEREAGQVTMSVLAVENLVEKLASQVDGVKEVKPRLFRKGERTGVRLKVAVSPDISIPEVSREVQNRVKEKVLEVTGLDIGVVSVYVESIAQQQQKARVE